MKEICDLRPKTKNPSQCLQLQDAKRYNKYADIFVRIPMQ